MHMQSSDRQHVPGRQTSGRSCRTGSKTRQSCGIERGGHAILSDGNQQLEHEEHGADASDAGIELCGSGRNPLVPRNPLLAILCPPSRSPVLVAAVWAGIVALAARRLLLFLLVLLRLQLQIIPKLGDHRVSGQLGRLREREAGC